MRATLLPTLCLWICSIIACGQTSHTNRTESGARSERIHLRLIDRLDDAQITLGSIAEPDESSNELELLARQANQELGEPWVALNAEGRRIAAEASQNDSTLLLTESACTILDIGELQDLELTAEMAAEIVVPADGAGRQQIVGEPIVVELDQRPRSIAEGCRIEFLMGHGLMPRRAEHDAAAGSNELRNYEISFTTMSQTRAVAVVLATGLIVSFGLHTQVNQQQGASARLGRLRLLKRGVQGLTRERFRTVHAPDPLLPEDSQQLRVKPNLNRQMRDAALAPPGTTLCWSLPIPADAALRFAIGVAWPHSATPGREVTFVVRHGDEVVFEETYSQDQTSWLDRRIPLAESAQSRELCLETRAEDGPGTIWSLWGVPELTVTSSRTDDTTESGHVLPQTIVLVSIDSLRADRLGVYGATDPTSPIIDRLARDSRVYENHTAQTGWTLPSHVSMLTGLAPEAHGVSGQMDRILELLDVGFDPTIPTLASALREAGYSTHGIVSAPYLESTFGFARGFDSYDTSTVSSHLASHSDITAPGVTQLARRIIGRSGRRPLFLFLHHWDVHYDYIPPREDLAAVHPARGRQEIDYEHTRHPFTRHIDPALFQLVATAGPHRSPPVFYRRVRELLPRFPRVRNFMGLSRDLYDGEIRFVDRHMGMVLEELRGNAREDSIIVITSDHGESFMEHGTLGHGVDNIYREGLVVPLTIHAPGRLAPNRHTQPSMTIDIMPTLLELVGREPVEGVQGVSLVRETETPRLVVGHDGSFGRVQATKGNLRLLTWGAFGPDLVYDIGEDPEELVEVGESRRPERAQLRRDVAAYLLRHGRGVHVAIVGDERPGSVEVILRAEEQLRPAFVYGPPDTGQIAWESEHRLLRLRAAPGVGEIVSMTVLIPDSLEVRLRVNAEGRQHPRQLVRVGNAEPLEQALSDARWDLESGALPAGFGARPGLIHVWRTPTFSTRTPLVMHDETMEQLRALGYLRGGGRASPDASVPADARPARGE